MAMSSSAFRIKQQQECSYEFEVTPASNENTLYSNNEFDFSFYMPNNFISSVSSIAQNTRITVIDPAGDYWIEECFVGGDIFPPSLSIIVEPLSPQNRNLNDLARIGRGEVRGNTTVAGQEGVNTL